MHKVSVNVILHGYCFCFVFVVKGKKSLILEINTDFTKSIKL